MVARRHAARRHRRRVRERGASRRDRVRGPRLHAGRRVGIEGDRAPGDSAPAEYGGPGSDVHPVAGRGVAVSGRRSVARCAALALVVAACGAVPEGSSPGHDSSPAKSPTASGSSSPVAVTASPVPSATLPARPSVGAGEAWLVFQSDAGGAYGLRLVRPDGTGLFAPGDTVPGTEQLHPDWSPDGSQLAFSVLGAASRDLWLMDADGGDARRIVACEACSQVDEPAWSPDGSTIVFWRSALGDDGTQFTLERYDVATGETQVILGAPAGRAITGPRWSPDGTRLVVELPH